MPLIMTLDEDSADASSSDDNDFEMAGAPLKLSDELAVKANSWGTARARKAAPVAPAATSASALDAKLAARAAVNAKTAPRRPDAAGAAGEGAELHESLEAETKERKPAGRKERGARAAAASALEAEAAAAAAGAAPSAPPSTTFSALKLSKPLLKAVSELGFATPTPIQAAVVPVALKGADICASAVTGSGKTAAFMLPALERLVHRPRRIAATRVLVLCPTRELAAQCEEMGSKLGRFTDVRFCLVVGGLSLKLQEAELRGRPDVVIATPGRLIDLLRNTPSVGLDELEVLVLDEADRLLEMGFQQEVEEVVGACPRSRQTLLFSATITGSVAELSTLALDKPIQVKVDPIFNVAERLQQEFVRLRPQKEHEREAVLLSLATRTFRRRAIVFLSSKKHAHRVKILFGLAGLVAAELHGNMTQLQRLQALDDFRNGKADFLLATDLAGRGLDIRGVTTVINYDLPTELKTYVHRVGRTARAGSEGRAVSIVAERDRAFLKQVLKHAADVVRTRTVPPDSVAYWVDRIAEFEEQVSAVLKEEHEEKQLRVAEMEVNKASNLMAHREEIMSRPARTWFQTEKERSADRAAAKAALPQPAWMEGVGGGASKRERDDERPPRKKEKKDKYAGMSRMRRRALQRDEMFAAANDGEGTALPNQKANARSVKAAARGQKLGSGAEKRKLPQGAPAGPPGKKKPKTAQPPARSQAEPKPKPREKNIPRKMRSKSKAKFSKPRKRK